MKRFILIAAAAVLCVWTASAEVDFDLQVVYQPLNYEKLNVFKVRGSSCNKSSSDELYRENELGIKAGISYIWDDSPSPVSIFTFYPGCYADFTYLKIKNARVKAKGNKSGLKTDMEEVSGGDYYLDFGIKGRLAKGDFLYLDLFMGLTGNIVSYDCSDNHDYSAFEFAGGAEIGAEAGIKLMSAGNWTPSLVAGAKIVCLEGFGNFNESKYGRTNFNGTEFNADLYAGIRFMKIKK